MLSAKLIGSEQDMTLPPGSTLRSIQGIVREEYVRAVLSNVASCEREMGGAVVVLSLTGDERCPDYNVGSVMDVNTGQTSPWQSFNGKTHKPISPNQEMRI